MKRLLIDSMRKKADGPAFEKEFKDAVVEKYYARRLHTAFTPNPADFIVVGKRFNYAEVKETAQESFSLATLQQLSEMRDYVKHRELYKDTALKESKYWLIVHFLSFGVIKVLEVSQVFDLLKKRTTLKPTTDCYSYSNLKELIEGGELF